jgi:alkanesulfonate monooxygenase SsuD/methylene tetrahydromethanopterin reductase-like flavin-dependent oxidoreductase (luciferase family)
VSGDSETRDGCRSYWRRGIVSSIEIGVFLPTFVYDGGRTGREITTFATHAEELGFASLWATDHLLHDSLFYAVPWLEPLMALTHAAAVTERVDLGTSVLVMPTRPPVLLAKQISTLQALSGERFILGAGTGWDEREFVVAGTEKRYRGIETDEGIEIVTELLSGRAVDFSGRRIQLDQVSIAPKMETRLRLWVGGGRQVAHSNSPERPVMPQRVLERIGRADGWIARPTATPEQIRLDLGDIATHLDDVGRDLSDITLAHENFIHLAPTDDPAEARAEQQRAFTRVMGERRPFEYFEQVYLTGTTDEIIAKIDQRIEAGIRYFIFHTLEPSVRQLDLWAETLLPHIRGAE